MTNNNQEHQIDFSSFEKDAQKEIQEEKQKLIWFGESNQPLKKRIYQFFATLIATLILNFSTKLKWQFLLVFYLLLNIIIGTYQIIKFIYNLPF